LPRASAVAGPLARCRTIDLWFLALELAHRRHQQLVFDVKLRLMSVRPLVVTIAA
jgi:hypothetical protein